MADLQTTFTRILEEKRVTTPEDAVTLALQLLSLVGYGSVDREQLFRTAATHLDVDYGRVYSAWLATNGEQLTLTVEAPRFPVGTRFTRRKGPAGVLDCEVIGYRYVHNTDTNTTKMTYRISYEFCGQRMIDDVPVVTIQRALAEVR